MSNFKKRVCGQIVLVLGIAFAGCQVAPAAEIVIVNGDAPNVGLNDPTPATPEGGNSGTTLGQQRMILAQEVADIWGSKLESAVPIRVQVSFTDNSPCQANPGDFVYLATSGPSAYYAVTGPPYPPGTIIYPSALRNALVGTVADPSTPEIFIQVNPKMDTVPDCISGYSGYWYGIDAEIASPASPKQFPLLTLLLHEMGHGLGFVEGVNLSTGAGFPPYKYIYNTLLYDTQIGKLWADMSDAERVTSATNDPNLVWTGSHVTAAAPEFMRQPLRVRSDSTVQPGDVLQAYFGDLLPRSGLSGQARLVDDGSANPGQGCSPLTNAAQIQGRIALVERGSCAFDLKAKNAQQAGAIAVLILNDRAETPGDLLPVASGSDFTVKVPTATVNYQAGLNLLAVVAGAPTTVVTVEPIPASDDMGTQAGYVRMHAPQTLAPLSSVNHFTTDSATPLLMQSAINLAQFDRTDLTEYLLRDLGWILEDTVFKDGFEN
jgi:hypothetical protein